MKMINKLQKKFIETNELPFKSLLVCDQQKNIV